MENKVEKKPIQPYAKYYLGNDYPGVYFTQKEAECAQHFLAGKTELETATILHLSIHTVIFYLNNMQCKLVCASKKELMRKIELSGFANKILPYIHE